MSIIVNIGVFDRCKIQSDIQFFKQKNPLTKIRGFVPRTGIEPVHLSILEFESSASTNSATWA